MNKLLKTGTTIWAVSQIVGAILAVLFLVLLFTGCGKNGIDGAQGPAGAPGAPGTHIEAQAFCPSIPGVIGYANRESYVIIGTSVYAVYADGTHTFLTLLNPGTYVTTDGRSCQFIVTSDGQVL